jgi:hypothetical protein
MDWLSQNWIWVLFAVVFVAAHLFGHGRHGGHGGCGGGHRHRETQPPAKREDAPDAGQHKH